MKTLALILALAMARSLGAVAYVVPLAPLITQTPVVPSTVTAGQLVTAEFNVYSDLAPISWSIGLSSLTDTTPSSTWNWVVDEDGAYGVTKTFMKTTCPTPGIMILAPAPALNPVYAPFVVPDYGPQVVTMTIHVRVRQGAQTGCAADSELYKVFVVNPAWTPTTTRTLTTVPTSTRTPTAGPASTLTPVPPTSTSTPTPVTTLSTPVATPVPVQGGQKPKVKVAMPVPNPGPKLITFYVEGVADEVRVGFYTVGETKVAEVDRQSVSGWSSVPVPALGHGGFIAKVTAYQGGVQTSYKFAYLYCI